MSFLYLLPAFFLGAVFGHGARRAIPRLLRLKERSLPFHQPWMELATATFFVILAWKLGWRLGPWPYVATMLLVAIAACDYLVKLIPDALTLPGAALAIAWGSWDGSLLLSHPMNRLGLELMLPELAQGPWAGAFLSLLGASFGFILLETIRRVFGLMAGLEVMGLGDSKLTLLIGAVLGPAGVISALPLAFLLGVIHGAVWLRLTGQPHSAFGPPLALGAWLAMVAGDQLLGALAHGQRLILALPLEVLAAIYSVLLSVAVWLIWRTRRKAQEYEQIIEADYQEIEERLDS